MSQLGCSGTSLLGLRTRNSPQESCALRLHSHCHTEDSAGDFATPPSSISSTGPASPATAAARQSTRTSVLRVFPSPETATCPGQATRPFRLTARDSKPSTPLPAPSPSGQRPSLLTHPQNTPRIDSNGHPPSGQATLRPLNPRIPTLPVTARKPVALRTHASSTTEPHAHATHPGQTPDLLADPPDPIRHRLHAVDDGG